MERVVHYHDSSRTYSRLKPVSENQYQRLLEEKSFREKEELETNQHISQCRSIPSNLNNNKHIAYI